MSFFGMSVLLLCLSLVFSILAGLFQKFGRITPTAIENRADMHTVLRALWEAGSLGETLFIVWFPSRFEVRVTRHAGERGPTLEIEIRSAGHNATSYAGVRQRFVAEAVEFVEEGRERRGRRLWVSWPEGGPFVVSAAAHVLAVLGAALPESPDVRCSAACSSPEQWRTDATLAA